jgi:ribosomal protein L35AE/L33A
MDAAKKEHASTQAIKQREEQQFAQMLVSLQQRNAIQEARAAISRGDYYVMGYNTGRGGQVIPGVVVRQNRCRVQLMDGMGDMIYGDNHMKYRIAAKRFANQFNQQMLPYCR